MPDPQHKFRAPDDLWHAAGAVLARLDSMRTITITVLPGASRSSICVDAVRRVAELEPTLTPEEPQP